MKRSNLRTFLDGMLSGVSMGMWSMYITSRDIEEFNKEMREIMANYQKSNSHI